MIRSRSIIVIVIIAIFIWVLFAYPQNLQHFRINLASIARLPLKVITRSLNYAKEIIELAYIDNEKLALKYRIRNLEEKLVKLEDVLLENKRLRELLSFKQKVRKSSIPAMVIGRDPNNWSSVVFIDKGTNSGIINDMVVISGEGLIGRIREAGGGMSKVMLINDIDSKVGAIVQRNREQGLLIGTSRSSCKLIYLSIEADVKKGDKILTSGMGSIYPKGILIGQVLKVEKQKGALYKYAIIEPAVKLSKLEEVLCMR